MRSSSARSPRACRPSSASKVILIGVLAALVLRIAFALIVTQLLQIVGLVLAGGLLLLWVAWRMWRELRHEGESAGSDGDRRRRAFRHCSRRRASPPPPGASPSPTSA